MVNVELREGATVRELIVEMAETYGPEFANAARSSVFVLNGKAATLDARLRDQDTVLMLPPAAGG